MKIPPQLVAPAIHFLYNVWCSSLRITEIGRERVDAFQLEGKPMVFSLWHDEVFPLMYLRRKLPIIAIVSRSNDGEYLARLLEALGHKTARGSSSRGGIAALLRTAKAMQSEGYFACVTVDGPRGPRHKVKEGAVFLASKTPAYVVPMRTYYTKRFRFNSWDKFQLPVPFSRVVVEFGEPYRVSEAKLSGDLVAKECKILEEKINKMEAPDFLTNVKKMWSYKLYSFLSAQMQKLSLKGLHCVARMIAFFCWYAMPSRRKVAVRALQKHLHFTQKKATEVAKESFYQNFASFLEIFYSGRLKNEPEQIDLGDSPGLQEYLTDTGPMVATTAHLGAWELMEAIASKSLPHKERVVVVRNQKDPAITEVMAELRAAGGMTVVGHRSASVKAMQCLRNNGVVAFLVDHNCSKKEAVFLPFLEDIAAVNQGPALLALRAKATVYPAFLLRKKGGGHSFYVAKPLRTCELKGTINERCEIIARFYTDAVAECIKKHPEQWFWMHKRWKTRP